MVLISDPQNRLWRTGSGQNSNEIYALYHNDVTKPSRNDSLVGSMESSSLAEIIVETHNLVMKKFGRHFIKALKADA